MSWKLTFNLKEGDPLLPIMQQQSLYSSFEKIVMIYDAGRYCFEHGRYLFANTDAAETEIINKYPDFFKNAGLSMLNTSILELLKLLATRKSNDAYSLSHFIQHIRDGRFGVTKIELPVLDQLEKDLELLHPSYLAAKHLRDKVIAHTDPDGIPRFSVNLIEELYTQVFKILVTLMESLFEVEMEKGTYGANTIKKILADLGQLNKPQSLSE
jgi:hypothetical protein